MKKLVHLTILTLLSRIILGGLLSNIPLIHIWVYAINIASIVLLIKNIGKAIVFAEFLSFSAITLWLTVPLFMWDLGADKLLVPNLFGAEILAIPENIYLNWAIPATLALISGLFLFEIKQKRLTQSLSLLTKYLDSLPKERALHIFIVGSIGLFAGKFVPSSAGFIFFLLSQLIFISVLYCLFGQFKYTKIIYLGAGLLSLIGVAASGMFGELVWWGLVIVIYGLLKVEWSFSKKLIIISSGILVLSTLQNIKNEYRRLTWMAKGGQEASLTLLGTTAWKTIFKSGSVPLKNSTGFVLYRMNQAYTVSRVMKFVPKKEPYANGETIFASLAASFVPRFLWPDKPMSGGHENMKRFARFDPHGGASYDIGQIGDAWANFGYWGGIIFLFVYGFFNSWLLKSIISVSSVKLPSLILWIPVVFLQLLKVEVSVLTNFNAAIKGVIFVALVFWMFKKMGVKL